MEKAQDVLKQVRESGDGTLYSDIGTDVAMDIDDNSIKEFCRRQSLTWKDREMQRACIEEEVSELMKSPPPEEYKEAVDVLVTVLVYANMSGFLHKIEDEFKRKMDINNKKPIRVGHGKVPKK